MPSEATNDKEVHNTGTIPEIKRLYLVRLSLSDEVKLRHGSKSFKFDVGSDNNSLISQTRENNTNATIIPCRYSRRLALKNVGYYKYSSAHLASIQEGCRTS